jgi:hypothetical protein
METLPDPKRSGIIARREGFPSNLEGSVLTTVFGSAANELI